VKKILLISSIIYSFSLYGQVGINNSSPNSTLEVTAKKTDGSTSEGIIAPRLTGDALHQAESSSKYGVLQDGTIAYVTAAPSAVNKVGQTISIDAKGYYYFDSTQNKWMKFRCGCSDDLGTVTGLSCSTATITGSLTSGSAASGVSASVPYTGGNGGSYSSQTVSSTGITGLTATLAAGTLANGSGSVVYSISGTPSAAGTASFPISLGGQSCTLSVTVGSAGAVITGLSCSTAIITGSLTSLLPASGVSASVPYTGGNGGTYSAQSVTSTGITGLTATLAAGTLANGSGSVVYSISGTPSAPGVTASFPISLGGQSCTLNIPVGAALPTGSGSLAGKTCFDVVEVNDGGDCGTKASRLSQKADFSLAATNTQTYTFTPTSAVSNVRFYYVNTNGQVINSLTGGNPTGLNISTPVSATVTYNTALNSLASGTTRATALTANIIVVYNNSATGTGTDVQLTLKVNVQDCACCGAYTAPGVFKTFMCQNLGADMTADPFTPSAAIHGAKYQWGYKPSNPLVSDSRYYTQQDDQANTGNIAGWNGYGVLPDGSWLDASKTANDPCPAGYRVPTQAQWTGVISNNTVTRTGSWANSSTNYTTALSFGSALLLPAAGERSTYYIDGNGILRNRGSLGDYWSSTQSSPDNGSFLSLVGTSTIYVAYTNRTHGMSIRCISE